MIKLACETHEPLGRPRRETFGEQDLLVLKLLARGKTREEIAPQFNVVGATVSIWIREMKREALARTDAHLVAIAKEQGLIE